MIADTLDLEGFAVKLHTVVGLDRQDVTECLEHRFAVVIAESQQIDIAGRAHRQVEPGGQQHRAFKDEPTSMGGQAQPVKQSFEGIARQDELELLAAFLGLGEQARAHRGSHIATSLSHRWCMPRDKGAWSSMFQTGEHARRSRQDWCVEFEGRRGAPRRRRSGRRIFGNGSSRPAYAEY